MNSTNEKQVKYLVEKVFQKAQYETGSTSVNGCCTYLETTFREDLNCYDGTSYKTFVRLHGKYITVKQPENSFPKPNLLDAMSVYLGYQNFLDFSKHFKRKRPFGENPEQIIIIILAFIISGLLCYNIFTSDVDGGEPKCMIWKKTHFVMISCHLGENINKAGQIMGYNSTLYKNMKMIPKKEVEVGSSYYYKESKDSLEFFSWYGKHPVHGDDLKPVTDYIVKKYINGQ